MAGLFPISQSKSKIGDTRQARAREFALVDIHDSHPPNFANLSAPWHTPMKEIIKGAIVIHPAFRSEVTFVTDKKGRVLIVPLKFH
jgi:hypothetical protein